VHPVLAEAQGAHTEEDAMIGTKTARQRGKSLRPKKYCGQIAWPLTGVVPLTMGKDISAEAWSYDEGTHLDLHVVIIRTSDRATLAHAILKVPR
jgi:hypothetical protein